MGGFARVIGGHNMSSADTYFKNIGKGFWTVLLGMKVTMRHLFTPAVTIQYPDARMPIPERGRNRLYVNMDDCIGCNQCGMACPVGCITIETAKSLPTEDLGVTSTGQKKRLWVTQFDIDFAKCCYCGLCVPPCPTECIYMTDVFEFSEYDRDKLNYSFITLTPEEAAQKTEQAKAAEKEAAAKKAAAAAAAAAQKAAQPQNVTPSQNVTQPPAQSIPPAAPRPAPAVAPAPQPAVKPEIAGAEAGQAPSVTAEPQGGQKVSSPESVYPPKPQEQATRAPQELKPNDNRKGSAD